MGAMVRAITGIYTENVIHFSLIFGSNRIVKYVKNGNRAVSYTHLTLPTIRLV